MQIAKYYDHYGRFQCENRKYQNRQHHRFKWVGRAEQRGEKLVKRCKVNKLVVLGCSK